METLEFSDRITDIGRRELKETKTLFRLSSTTPCSRYERGWNVPGMRGMRLKCCPRLQYSTFEGDLFFYYLYYSNKEFGETLKQTSNDQSDFIERGPRG